MLKIDKNMFKIKDIDLIHNVISEEEFMYKVSIIIPVFNGENHLIPPFRTIDGLGDAVSKLIVEEREKRPFLSIEDLQQRAKISGTLIDKLRDMHILDGLPESSQLSLF